MKKVIYYGSMVAAIAVFVLVVAVAVTAILDLSRTSQRAVQQRDRNIEICANYCTEVSYGAVCDRNLDQLSGRVVDGECLCYLKQTSATPWDLPSLDEIVNEEPPLEEE